MPRYECYQCHQRREATTPAELVAASNDDRCLCPDCHDLARVVASLYHTPPDDDPMRYRAAREPIIYQRYREALSDRDGRVVRKSGPMS